MSWLISLQRRETNDHGGTPRRAEAWRAWRTWRRDEPLVLAHRTRLASFHSVRAYRLGGHVRDARRSIHETPSFLSEGTTNRVVKKTSDRRDTRQRVCASTRCACCSWMPVPRSRREGACASQLATPTRLSDDPRLAPRVHSSRRVPRFRQRRTDPERETNRRFVSRRPPRRFFFSAFFPDVSTSCRAED